MSKNKTIKSERAICPHCNTENDGLHHIPGDDAATCLYCGLVFFYKYVQIKPPVYGWETGKERVR